VAFWCLLSSKTASISVLNLAENLFCSNSSKKLSSRSKCAAHLSEINVALENQLTEVSLLWSVSDNKLSYKVFCETVSYETYFDARITQKLEKYYSINTNKFVV
jgi:hypothetical protein